MEGVAGACGEYLDADLARTGIGDGLLFGQFQDLWAAEPGDTDILPSHTLIIAPIASGSESVCGAMPAVEFNSHDVRFQAERMFF